MFCGHCGARNDDGAGFCSQCGQALRAATPASATDPPPAASPAPYRAPAPSFAPSPPPYAPPYAQAASAGGSNALLPALIAVLGIAVVAVGLLIFAGDAIRTILPAGMGGAGGQTAQATPSGVAVSIPTGVPVSMPASPTAPPATATVVSTTPTSAASPTAARSTPTRPPAAPTAVPKPPTAAPPTRSAEPVLGPMVSNDAMGVRVRPIQGWQKQEQVDGLRRGSLAFFAPGDPNRTFHFNRPGLFTVYMWPLSSQELVPSEDLLLGFVDSLLPEYVTKFRADADVSNEPLQRMRNAKFQGSTTTVTLTGAKGNYKYLWYDVSKDAVAIYIFCGGAAEEFDRLQPACVAMYSSIDFWFSR